MLVSINTLYSRGLPRNPRILFVTPSPTWKPRKSCIPCTHTYPAARAPAPSTPIFPIWPMCKPTTLSFRLPTLVTLTCISAFLHLCPHLWEKAQQDASSPGSHFLLQAPPNNSTAPLACEISVSCLQGNRLHLGSLGPGMAKSLLTPGKKGLLGCCKLPCNLHFFPSGSAQSMV